MNKQVIRNSQDIVFYEAEMDMENNWVYINWIGDIDLVDVKRGCEAFLELLSISKATKLLNDNRLLTSNYLEVNEWIEERIIPQSVELGLRHFAQVLSPKFIARFSGIELGLRTKPLDFKAFKTIDQAKKWLENK